MEPGKEFTTLQLLFYVTYVVDTGKNEPIVLRAPIFLLLTEDVYKVLGNTKLNIIVQPWVLEAYV